MGVFDNYKTSVTPYQPPKQQQQFMAPPPRPSGGGFSLNPFLKFGAGILHGAENFLTNKKTPKNLQNDLNNLLHDPTSVIQGANKAYTGLTNLPQLLLQTKQGRDIAAQTLQATPRSTYQLHQLGTGEQSFTPKTELEKTVFGKGTINKPKDSLGYLGTAAGLAPPVGPKVIGSVLGKIGSKAIETIAPKVGEGATQAAEAISKEMPHNTPQSFVDAAKKIIDHYTAPIGKQKDIPALVNTTAGHAQRSDVYAKDLGSAIKEALPSSSDRLQVRDLREGALAPHEVQNPVVHTVAKALDVLDKHGFDVRKALDPTLQEVSHYSTRLPLFSGKGAGTGSRTLMNGTISKFKDLFSTESRFSQARQVGKFVSEDGSVTKFGNPKAIGLAPKAGNYVDKSGAVFHAAPTTSRELGESGLPYVKDSAKIAEAYHSDTGRLAARKNAIDELKTNAEHYGLNQNGEGVPITHVPELSGYSADAKTVKTLEDNLSAPTAKPLADRIWQGITTPVMQGIVFNPLIHGSNMYLQALKASGNTPLFKGSKIGSGPIGAVRFHLSLAKSFGKDGKAMFENYLSDGGHVMTYGAKTRTVLTDAMDKVNAPHFSKLNAKAMQGIEAHFRSAAHDANVSQGMDPVKSIKQIDTFLGSKENAGRIASNIGMFYHWLKTEGKSIYASGRHPLTNAGANTNLALTSVATMWGLQKAWQEVTGNPNAHLRVPGEAGLVKMLAEAPGQVKKGELPSVVQSHINPLVTAIANQAYGKNLFTGKQLATTGDRKNDLLNTLVGPSQDVSKTMQGRNAPGETAAKVLFGAYTPHASGNVASPKLGFLNAKGATENKGPGNDVTGYSQQQKYFAAIDKAKQAAAGDKRATDTINSYLDRTKNDKGQTIQLSPRERIANASELYANDKARSALQNAEKSQPGHDPMWDLSPDKLKTFLNYEKMFTGSADKANLVQQNPWISDLNAARSKLFGALPPGNAVASSETPQYPKFDSGTTNNLALYYSLSSSAERGQFLNDHPDVGQALTKIFTQYTNPTRVAEGAAPLKGMPQASPQLQKVMDTYSKLPSGKGIHARSDWIKANPDLWNQMTNFFMNSSVYELGKNAALSQFQGNDLNQQALKAAYSLGQFNIAKNKDGTYSLDPNASRDGGSGGSGSGFSNYYKIKSIAQSQKNTASFFRSRTKTLVKAGLVHNKTVSPLHVHGKKEYIRKSVHVGRLRLK